jgi:hypothetical protein
VSQHVTQYESTYTDIRSVVAALRRHGLNVLHVTERTYALRHHGKARPRPANTGKVLLRLAKW